MLLKIGCQGSLIELAKGNLRTLKRLMIPKGINQLLVYWKLEKAIQPGRCGLFWPLLQDLDQQHFDMLVKQASTCLWKKP